MKPNLTAVLAQALQTMKPVVLPFHYTIMIQCGCVGFVSAKGITVHYERIMPLNEKPYLVLHIESLSCNNDKKYDMFSFAFEAGFKLIPQGYNVRIDTGDGCFDIEYNDTLNKI